MKLNEKQSRMFVEWYKERYNPDGQNLPTLPKSEEKFEEAARHLFIDKML